VVVRRPADVVDVPGAEALLAARRPGEFQLALPQEVVFELVHAGGREQHARVPPRHQHVAGAHGAALGDKEIEVLVAQLVGFHRNPLFRREPWPRGPASTPAQKSKLEIILHNAKSA